MACLNLKQIGIPSEISSKFKFPEKFGYRAKLVRCGVCRWCRLIMIREWVGRCLLEASLHEKNSFLNLTYAPEHLPADGTLKKKHLSGFLKRLRASLDYHYEGTKIRFYASGEYGSKNGRPHYHVLIFGFDFPDKYYWRRSDSGYPLYRSDFLEKSWKYGHVEVGTVTQFSSRYVAKYISKKWNGPAAEKRYQGREKEFSLSSTTPGIAFDWYQANKHWIWRDDAIRIEGFSMYPPKYFERIFQKEDRAAYDRYLSGRYERRKADPLFRSKTDMESDTDDNENS